MDTRAGRTRLAAVTLSTFALSLGSVLPATAAPKTFTYDALGDSYAVGLGVDPGQAYPYVLDGRMRIALEDLAAVSGATAGDNETTPGNVLAAQLGALDKDTDLVTISIGGNDIGWTDAITICLLLDDQSCAGAVAGSTTQITDDLPALLDKAYTLVRAEAPNAHIVVTGYPRLFSPEYGDYIVPLTPDFDLEASVAEQQLMNDGADLLNTTIRGVAEAHGFQFVDVTQRFIGHGVNADEAWINGPLTPVGSLHPAAFHPTVDGQHAYGVALRAAIKPPDLR